MGAETIPGRLLSNGLRHPEQPCWWLRSGDSWRSTSWSEAAWQVRRAGRALISLGLRPGDRVCILGFNRPAWIVADVAAMAAGGVPAGIYQTCSAEEVGWILRHAGAQTAFVEDQAQLAKVLAQASTLPELKRVVQFPNTPLGAHAGGAGLRVMNWDEFMATASDTTESTLQDRLDSLTDDQPATFIYTSGTTGPPKAVMLSHRNLAWTAALACEMGALGATDCTVSYLPLCHIAEQLFSIHAPIWASSQVFFARGPDSLLDDLKSVQPTVFLGVPRVWEKFHAAVSTKLAQATGAKRNLVNWAMDVARRVHAARNRGQRPGLWLSAQHQLACRLVFDKLKPALGLGRARFCVTGAAPISRELLTFFAGLDITIHEVYGQSEDTGPTTFNLPGNTRFGTVGTVLPGTKLRIADDGEIQVFGPHVFLGYFNDSAATAAALVDGWLQSGDLGRLDPDGFLHITGRKKEIIITAGGKNIAPVNIESALRNLELVSQAVVIGDRRKYVSALLTLDPDAVARRLGRSLDGPPMANTALVAALQEGVDSVNARLARVEHIRRFTALDHDFTVEDGQLTPTLKLKRRVVDQRYAVEIEAMYS